MMDDQHKHCKPADCTVRANEAQKHVLYNTDTEELVSTQVFDCYADAVEEIDARLTNVIAAPILV